MLIETLPFPPVPATPPKRLLLVEEGNSPLPVTPARAAQEALSPSLCWHCPLLCLKFLPSLGRVPRLILQGV